MPQSLLQMAQRVVRRLPLTTVPESVVGNNDPGTLQLLEMFQEEGEELYSKHAWSSLVATWSIVIASDPQTEDFPDDYGRVRTRASFWRSGSELTPLSGPVTPDEWHRLSFVSGGFPGYWRPYTTGVQILGVPTGETVTAEYISRNFVLDDDGSTTKPAWAEDTDTSLVPDVLIMAGVRWRWKQSKGLEYAEDMVTYERELERRIAADRITRPISISRITRDDGFPFPTWPGQITT